MTHYFSPILLLACFGLGCDQSTAPSSSHLHVFNNANSLDVFERAPSATAYRLKPGITPSESLDDYEVASGPTSLTDEQITLVRSIMLDRDNFIWDTVKSCIPNYGIQIHFELESNSTDLLFCFSCDQLAVYYNGHEVRGEEDFDKARSQLVSLAKELFPDDSEIQSL